MQEIVRQEVEKVNSQVTDKMNEIQENMIKMQSPDKTVIKTGYFWLRPFVLMGLIYSLHCFFPRNLLYIVFDSV